MAYGLNVIASVHWDVKDLHIVNFKSMRSITLREKYALTCRFGGAPGTWEVTLQFSKDPPFRNFKMLASLRRIDDGENALDAFLSVTLEDIQGQKCPVLYNMDHIFEGKEEKSKMFDVNHFQCLFLNNNLLLDILVIKPRLLVKGCQCQHDLDAPDCISLCPKL